MGAREDQLPLPQTNALLADELNNDGDRPHYVRGQMHAGKFASIGRQESHALYGLSRANALVRLPAGATFQSGETIAVIPLD
jgi:molybdopterin molybdotransferase